MSGVAIPPYAPSVPEWMRQVSIAFGKAITTSDDGHTIVFGEPGGVSTWDTVSDSQVFVAQTQPTFLANGSLGAIYGQRLNTYTGGASSDATTPTCAAVRGYNQIQATVTYCNEVGGLFVTDNYSWLGQATGVYGQANSYHGGRTFGLEAEGVEHSESFTATAGQTTFAIPNGYSANQAIVTKNGTLLTRTTDYADTSGTNIVLTAGAAAGDAIKVYRGDPQFAQQGGEITVYGAGGTDNNNTFSGNRVGLSIYGWRQDATTTHTIHIGSILNLVAKPDDANLIADRGINFRGRFDRGIDFTSSDAAFASYLIKLPHGGLVNSTLLMLGDGTNTGRFQASASSGVIFGSDTTTDVLFTRNGSEIMRLSGTSGASGVGVKMALVPASTTYANDAAAATGGVPVGGVYRNGSALMVRIS